MAAGTSSQQNFRKAIGAIKDSTLVGIAKVNSEYKGLNVSILKATNHVEVLPKEKHVRIILGAVSGSRPRADVSYCIHALTKRLSKTRTWVVALKTLIVIHRALREVDHSFCEELIYHKKSRGRLFNLLRFRDDSSPSAWDYSTWIRAYAQYMEECLECFRALKYDFHRDHSRTKKFDAPALLEQLPALQQLLSRLLACEPKGAAKYNFMIQYALSIVAAESVRLYVAITDGVLVLVDKYFVMLRQDAVRALEIYRKSGEQGLRLSEFFELCRSLDFGRRQKYVKIEQPPASFLATMEEYIKHAAPQSLMLTWKDNDDDNTTPKLIAVPEDKLENDPELATTEENTKTDKRNTDATPLIPDLLSWDEPSQEAPELDEGISLPLSITTADLSDPTIGSDFSSEPASWELALVATTSDASSLADSKSLVLDRSTLASLYDAALTKPNTNEAHQTGNVYSNPFETDDYNQGYYYDQALVLHPSFMQQQDHQLRRPMIGYDYMQMAGIPQQQPSFLEQHHPQQQQDHQQRQPVVISYGYMQMAGIPQQQQHYPQQQQEPLFAGHDLMQMIEMPQLGVSMQQQEKSMHGSANPFDEQIPSPAASPSQSSDLSFI